MEDEPASLYSTERGQLEMEVVGPLIPPSSGRRSIARNRERTSTNKRVFAFLFCILMMVAALNFFDLNLSSEENNTHVRISTDSVEFYPDKDGLTNDKPPSDYVGSNNVGNIKTDSDKHMNKDSTDISEAIGSKSKSQENTSLDTSESTSNETPTTSTKTALSSSLDINTNDNDNEPTSISVGEGKSDSTDEQVSNDEGSSSDDEKSTSSDVGENSADDGNSDISDKERSTEKESSSDTEISTDKQISTDNSHLTSEDNLDANGKNTDRANTNVTKKQSSSDLRSSKNNNEHGIKFAWLMSFPNSGTSYTMKMASRVSEQTTASNYGYLNLGDDGLTIVFEDIVNATKIRHSQGPFRKTMERDLPPKDSFILTKTHCGARCTECPPSEYVSNLSSFKMDCARGRRTIKDPSSPTKTKEIKVKYDPTIIQSAIHLIRDPFDNIVSRFHLHYKHKVATNDEDWLKTHPKNATGFNAYCRDNNARYIKEEAEYHKDIKDFALIPCFAEFFRYTQWHNLAFEVVEDMGIPVHMVHYEDYDDDFDHTLLSIFAFLKLDVVGKPDPFYSSDYSDHFTGDERKKVIALVKTVASKRTWSQLSNRYSFIRNNA